MNKYFSINRVYKLIFFSIAVIILIYMASSISLSINEFSNDFGVDVYDGSQNVKNEVDQNVGYQVNTSSAGVVIEASTKRVLYSQNMNTRLEMASTTKVMTALVVLENMPLDKEIKIPDEAVGVEGSSIYLGYDEIWTIQDLLYGLMLRSGNDSATALAIATGGSLESFVEMMNQKAKELGLTNTHFDNPHGLHSDNHYTSAYDLAVISACAMQNEKFVEIVSSKSYTTDENNTHEKQYFVNKNKLLFGYEGANGIKTGYTTASGRCLVASALRDGMQVVCVVLNCYEMWERCPYLMDKAFEEYAPYQIAETGENICTFEYNNIKYGLSVQNDLVLPLKDNEKINLQGYFDINEDLSSPLKAGSLVGKIKFYDGNHLLFESNIVNIEEINNIGALQKLSNLVGEWQVNNINGEIEQIFGVNGGSI